jgi:serine/threonine protein kinase
MTKFVKPYEHMPALAYNGMIIDFYSYIIIPLCEKGTLLDLLMKACSEEQDLLLRLQGYLASKTLDALDFLHNVNGLGHLDLKPDNLVITNDHLVALIDFAHANRVGTPVALCTGTDQYLAPEVRAVYNGSYTGYIPEKVDSFDYGICLFTMMFKKMPFAEATK